MDHSTNLPPLDADPLRDRLVEQYAAIMARAAELAAGFNKVPDEIDAASIDRATAFVKQVRVCAQQAEEARTAEGREFLAAKRTVDAFFMAVTKQMAEISSAVERRMADYLEQSGKVRSALGGTATLVTRLEFEVTDKIQAIKALSPWIDDDALAKAARSYIAAMPKGQKGRAALLAQPVMGVRFFERHTARVV